MSKEIKFRAWDKEEKRYRRIVRLNYDDGELDSITVYDTDDFAPTILPLERVILEQYTGLKDKNGKEIYEGDIVKTNSPDRANFNAGAIVMQQQMYLIINTPTYGDARLSHSEPLGYYCDTEIEVIGNIHENPELLEGEE